MWQFQDVKPEVDLILAAMFTMPQNANIMTIVHHTVHPLVLVGQALSVGSLQTFLYLAIESLTSFVNDSIAINHRGLVTCISKTATVLFSY